MNGKYVCTQLARIIGIPCTVIVDVTSDYASEIGTNGAIQNSPIGLGILYSVQLPAELNKYAQVFLCSQTAHNYHSQGYGEPSTGNRRRNMDLHSLTHRYMRYYFPPSWVHSGRGYAQLLILLKGIERLGGRSRSYETIHFVPPLSPIRWSDASSSHLEGGSGSGSGTNASMFVPGTFLLLDDYYSASALRGWCLHVNMQRIAPHWVTCNAHMLVRFSFAT